MMRRLAVLTVLLVSGCYLAEPWSSRTPVVGPDGRDDWWEIRCHRDDQGCWKQARAACPHGFQIHDREARKYFFIKCVGPSGDRNIDDED